jgi:hypothetical protein
MRPVEEWLTDSTTFTTSLLTLLADHFDGIEFVNWDPVTISIRLQQDFKIDPPQFLVDRVNAGASLFVNPLFHRSLEAFSQICNVLNFGVVSSEVMIPADLDDVLWGCTEAMLLEGDMYKEEGFSHNIARYVGVLLETAGVRQPPSVLRFAEYDERGNDNLTANSADDPLFAKVYWGQQQEQKDLLEELNQRQLLNLFEQLQQLPVRGLQKQALLPKIEKLREVAS